MIYTSYYANLRNIPDHIRPIAISSTIPEGMVLTWWPEFAPTWTMRTQYKKTGDRETFRRRYMERLGRIDLSGLAQKFPRGDVVLLCYEKDPVTCHRSILAEWFRDSLGISVQEWRAV